MATLLFDFQHHVFQNVTQQSEGFVCLCFVLLYNWSWFCWDLEVQKSRELTYALSQWPMSCGIVLMNCRDIYWENSTNKGIFLEISLLDKNYLHSERDIKALENSCYASAMSFPWPFYFRCGWWLASNM